MAGQNDIESRLRALEEAVCELTGGKYRGVNYEEAAPSHTRSVPGVSPMVTRGPPNTHPKGRWDPVFHHKPVPPPIPQSWDATATHQQKQPDSTYEPTFKKKPEIPQQWVSTSKTDIHHKTPTSWPATYKQKPPPVPQTWHSSQHQIPSGQYSPTYEEISPSETREIPKGEYAPTYDYVPLLPSELRKEIPEGEFEPTYDYVDLPSPQPTRSAPCPASPCQTRGSPKMSPMPTRGPVGHGQDNQSLAALYSPPKMEHPDGEWDPTFERQKRNLEVEPDAIFTPPKKHQFGGWDPTYDLIQKPPNNTSPDEYNPPHQPPQGGPDHFPPKHDGGFFDPERDGKKPPQKENDIKPPKIHPPKHHEGDYDPERDGKHKPPQKEHDIKPPKFHPPKHHGGVYDPECDGKKNDKRLENLETIICKIAGTKYGTCYEVPNHGQINKDLKGLVNFGDCFLQCLLADPNRGSLNFEDVLECLMKCICHGCQPSQSSSNGQDALMCLKKCFNNCFNRGQLDQGVLDKKNPRELKDTPPRGHQDQGVPDKKNPKELKDTPPRGQQNQGVPDKKNPKEPKYTPPKQNTGSYDLDSACRAHGIRENDSCKLIGYKKVPSPLNTLPKDENDACKLIGYKKLPSTPNTLPKCDPCQYTSTSASSPPPSPDSDLNTSSPVSSPCTPSSEYQSWSVFFPCQPPSDGDHFVFPSVPACAPTSDTQQQGQTESSSPSSPCTPAFDCSQLPFSSTPASIPSPNPCQYVPISTPCQPTSCVRTKNVEGIVSQFNIMENEAFNDLIHKKDQIDAFKEGEASLS